MSEKTHKTFSSRTRQSAFPKPLDADAPPRSFPFPSPWLPSALTFMALVLILIAVIFMARRGPGWMDALAASDPSPRRRQMQATLRATRALLHPHPTDALKHQKQGEARP